MTESTNLLLEKKERCKISCVKLLKFVDLIGSHYLDQLLHILTLKTIVKMLGKVDVFKKHLRWRAPNLFGKEGNGCYLFELLHSSHTIKSSKNVVKKGCF